MIRRSVSLACALAALALVPAAGAQEIPAPESVLGFVPGTTGRLAGWPLLVRYYQALAAASDRVEFRELGKTTNGNPFVVLVISSAANLGRLEHLRAVNARLADPRTIGSDAEREQLLRDGRTIVLITSSIHSTEVGGHLAPAVMAHRLATATDAPTLDVLDRTVLLLVPSLNPDGVTIVTRWYDRTVGTPAEATSPPELYHPYVGHDNNRDWYVFTQAETRLTVDSLHNVWHPQIVHDIHQQGAYGSRLFLPPYLDPIEPNVDPLLVWGVNALGTSMAWELAGQGKRGIVVNATYDAWTPARAYQHYHGGVRILSETASARIASDLAVEPDELRGRRGFEAHASSWNFPEPWPGGRWTLANIVDYQTSGALALLTHAAAARDTWLRNFLAVGQRAVRGWSGWPYAYVVPRSGQRGPGLAAMLDVLRRGQVEIRAAEAPFTAARRQFAAGDYVIPLRQPYAAFAKTLLERQRYPDLREYPGGPPKPPYDVTAHTLPLLMDVVVAEVRDSIPVPLSAPVTIPPFTPRFAGTAGRVGLYRSYTASMDEGWTRWLFDTWGVPYTSLVDSVVRAGDLRRRLDVIVMPALSARAIEQGLDSQYPAPYAGGLGQAGVAALRVFVEAGGTLVTFNESSRWAVEAFRLPVRDDSGSLDDRTFYAPGSIFRLDLDAAHPLARNAPARTIAWFEEGPLFAVTDGARARVVGRFAREPEDVLLSGWVLGPEHAAGRPALIEVPVGRGRVILFGFRPQYRGHTIATFPLLFNALGAADR
ncbi:MAG TPA: M14 metallopeptidase family protein [Gemmatimonadales bacterium]